MKQNIFLQTRARRSALSIVFFLFAFLATAQGEVLIGRLYYELNTDTREAVVTNSIVNNDHKVVVPATVSHEGIEYTVIEIGRDALDYYLKSLTLPSTIKKINNRFFYLEEAIIGCDSIGNNWFSVSQHLKTLVLQNTVRVIGYMAFSSCPELTKVVIPNSVKTIKGMAFNRCENLASVEFGNSVETIEDNAFGDTSISEITFPNSLKTLGSYIFGHHNNLASVNLGNSVETISNHAFCSCASLTEIVIPASVKFIGDSAFDCEDINGKGGLQQVTLQCSDVTYEGKYNVFGFSSSEDLKKVIFDCEVVPDIFGNFSSIENVVFTNKVKTIGEGALKGCSGISDIVIPESVTTIGQSAFQNCSGISEIVIPESVTSIGNYAFLGCSALKSFTVKSKQITFGENLFYYIYGYSGYSGSLECVNLNCEDVPAKMFDGINTITEVVLGESVKSVGENAFDKYGNVKNLSVLGTNTIINCKFGRNLEKVIYNSEIIPYIEDYGLFSYNENLKEVTLGESVKTIGLGAFSDCISLTEITLPEGLESIGRAAFSGSGFTSLTIPANVSYIGEYAFDCPNMTSLISYIVDPFKTDGDYLTSSDLWHKVTLYVPAGSSEKYRTTGAWWNFHNIVEMPVNDIQVTNAFSINADKIYNLRGQRLSAPQKGINIINGKKVMVK